MLRTRISETELYDYNKGFLYRYNDTTSKLTVCAKVRKPGYELADGCRKYTPKGEAGNEEKLPSNVRRAKAKVFELALCNTFDHFVTLTFSPDKVADRHDLDALMKSFAKWLNNYGYRRAGSPLRYLLIPEPHEDGAWHLHGLISGIPTADLHRFELSEHLPQHILNELEKGHDIYQWTAYDRKYGFCTLSPIRDPEAVSKYITKYITKELDSSIKELNAHMYYRSHGLQEKELLYSEADCFINDPDYTGEYCQIKNATDPTELLRYFPTFSERRTDIDPEGLDTPMAALLQAEHHQGAFLPSA